MTSKHYEIEITVRKLHAGDAVWRDNVIFYGSAEEGTWGITCSLDCGDILTSGTKEQMVEFLGRYGFEYVPRKRIYRR